MSDKRSQIKAPEHTAVRVALWRALHVQIDQRPHVFTDEIGLKIVGEVGWCEQFSKSMRASIVARSRFIEDLVEEQHHRGVTQYVILGAGPDTIAMTFMLALAQEAGFKSSQYVSADDLFQRYLAHRPDDSRAGSAEGFLVALTK